MGGLLQKLGVLAAHVLDLHGLKGAVGQGLLQHLAGVVGVDVDLDDLVIVHQHQGVPQGAEEAPEGLRVLLGVPGADKFGAVAELDVPGLEGAEVGVVLNGRVLLLGPLGHGHPPELVQHPLEDHQKALAPGIHHPGLFQHGVLIDGIGQGDVALLEGLVQDELHGEVLLGGLGGPAGAQPGDGQNGTLGGLHDRLVGGGHTAVQGCGEVGAVGGIPVLEGLGKAPEEQGQDDPGVAPGPPQQGVGVGLGRRPHPGEGLLPQLGGGGGDGHAHVGAGVPVGDREDVELVDLLLLGADGGRRVDDHPGQQRPVNGSSHVQRSFLMTVWAAASADDHGIHADIHAADLDAGKRSTI